MNNFPTKRSKLLSQSVLLSDTPRTARISIMADCTHCKPAQAVSCLYFQQCSVILLSDPHINSKLIQTFSRLPILAEYEHTTHTVQKRLNTTTKTQKCFHAFPHPQ